MPVMPVLGGLRAAAGGTSAAGTWPQGVCVLGVWSLECASVSVCVRVCVRARSEGGDGGLLRANVSAVRVTVAAWHRGAAAAGLMACAGRAPLARACPWVESV